MAVREKESGRERERGWQVHRQPPPPAPLPPSLSIPAVVGETPASHVLSPLLPVLQLSQSESELGAGQRS